MLKPAFQVLALSALSLALISCSTKTTQQPGAATSGKAAGISGPNNFKRPGNDGAPWWDVDVSNIPDAVPMPHTGNFKASPYVVFGKQYVPIQNAHNYREEGTASWYGTKFHGQNTANGEVYDLYGMTAAHKTLPLPSYVKVTNLDNGKQVTLRVNDRGPFYSDRIIDLSFAAAKRLGYAEKGVARVRVEGIDPVAWWAARGQPVPSVLADAHLAKVQVPEPAPGTTEVYTPPVTQHAGALLPLQVSESALERPGHYLQMGAFANPDAAQLLRDKLAQHVEVPVEVSSIARDNQVLHRVRMGPVNSRLQAEQLQQQLAAAALGAGTVVDIN
ncbi:hypothetical protein AKN87_01045 [Thiopseudomonas alkaliphila]|uniref:septal ring lytic transglycosylase RlpA family protein n=1 Tax=Thiopseudomonas alkaliphila TaxID=1697053 RepID=UPI00069CBEA3|nr:septal ring lytic transglycosylase RlpA family protein [Thiopseudomonas alkaliphila]AKX43856.1 hypothetical protein AKN87_01045 [Thiopseudomonas alkaliphila]